MKQTHALAVVLSLFAVACSSYGDVCDKRNKCIGGNDKDKQVCIDTYEAQERAANDYNCGSQYSDYHSCVTKDSNYSCNNGSFSTPSCDFSKVAACEYSNSGVRSGNGKP
jgi:hypothetical protein